MTPKRVSTTTTTNTNKGKRSIVKENVEARKKATFDKDMFTTLELAKRCNFYFTNRTMIPGKNINFAKLGYL